MAAVAIFVAIPLSQAAVSTSPPGAYATQSVTCGLLSGSAETLSVSGAPSGSAKEVLAISWRAVDDEDSGLFGYWALDTYNSAVSVWEYSNGSYFAIQTFSGVFEVPQGALSPQSGVSEPASGYGTLAGVIFGWITSSEVFHKGTNVAKGNLGDLNYGGTTQDLLNQTYQYQVGDASAYNWYTTYFLPADPGNTYFSYSWGFTYVLNSLFTTNAHGSSTSTNTWCNWETADVGDIVTASGE